MKFLRKCFSSGQKGAVLVAAACSMGTLMFAGALTADLGYMYYQKGQLQNAADAAALAGANAYKDKLQSYAQSQGMSSISLKDIDDTTLEGAKDAADDLALEFVDKNLGDERTIGTAKKYQDQGDEAEDVIYYRVKLDKDTPTFFLKYFTDNTWSVSADAIASINLREIDGSGNGSGGSNNSGDPSHGGGSGYFKDLFVFKHKFDAVNSIVNPDVNAIQTGLASISNTFDGKIVFTDGSGDNAGNRNGYNYTDLQYSAQTSNVPCFATEAGKRYSTVRDMAAAAIAASGSSIGSGAGECTYDASGQLKDTGSSNYWSRVEFENIDMMDFGSAVAEMSYKDTSRNQNLNISSLSASDKVLHVHSDVQNLTINIDSALAGSDSPSTANEPLYLYCDPGITGVLKIEMSADNVRPLVICAPGTGTDWQGNVAGPNVQVNLNGHNFRGIIYAPNSVVEPFNAAKSTFTGTIAADSISLRGDDAAYKYENFFTAGGSASDGGDGSGDDGDDGNGSTDNQRAVKLVNGKNLQWPA